MIKLDFYLDKINEVVRILVIAAAAVNRSTLDNTDRHFQHIHGQAPA